MTFDEAKVKKAKLPATITYKGAKMKIYVVPQSNTDLERFIHYLDGHRINSRTALDFSSDKQFTVKGIILNREATTILTYNELLNEIR